MSNIRNISGSAKTKRSRTIKLAPMTRAVRSALAVSAIALALGASGGAFAAGPKAPQARVLKVERAAIDFAPVHDLTVASSDIIGMVVPPELYATLISESEVGDVVIDNVDPISQASVADSTIAISGHSSEGNVGITNHAGADLYAGSVLGSAIGIYGYAPVGDVAIDNAAEISAYSGYGLADGIFASGADVDVSNSGAIDAYGYTWAAGIEAQGAESTTVTNSGDISVSTAQFSSSEYYVFEYYTDGVDYTANTSEGGSYTRGGYVAGIYVTAGSGGAQVDNSGDITADGGYHAYGIQVASGGDVVVTNSGDITVGGAGAIGYSDVYYSDPSALPYTYVYSSYSLAYGSQLATGISAVASDEGANVSIANSGTIVAEGYYGATGISATASGAGGAASVTNTGDVYAFEYAGALGAYGIVAAADGDASVSNDGNVFAVSGSGYAAGLTALSFAGTASVDNTGMVYANGKYATGVAAAAANGDAAVSNEGDVYAIGAITGTGISAIAPGNVLVENSGTVYAYGGLYDAYGVAAISAGGDVVVDNQDGGSIGFYSFLDDGFGVLAIAYQGDVAVSNAGTIEGYGFYQAAGVFGVALEGDVTVHNSGVISVNNGKYTDAAVGVFARADYGTASVTNSGDITASNTGNFAGAYGNSAFGVLARGAYVEVANSGSILADGYYYATGIAASSYYGTTVTNGGGSISAIAVGGGTGIDAQSLLGDVLVDNASDIDAVGIVFGARGINAVSAYGDVTVDNSGDVYAGSLYGDSIGIYAYSAAGDSSVDNSGDITAISRDGLADGIFASGANVDVANSGAIETYGYTWTAGIEAQGSESVSVTNSGDISASAAGFYQVYAYTYVDSYNYGGAVVAYAPGYTAFGIYATGGEGGAAVTNSGSIEVQGGYVTGIEVQSSGDAAVTNSGDIVAGSGLLVEDPIYNPDTYTTYYIYGGTQVATGINATSNGEGAAVTVTNSGDISADSIFGGTGISATSGGYGGTASVANTGDITAAQYVSGGYGAFGIVVSADGDASVNTSGAITVTSGGTGYGAAALSFAGDAMVVNSGDVSVEASTAANKYYGSYGLLAFAGNGYAAVGNSGSVSVSNEGIGYAPARAVDAQGQQGVMVSNSGSLYANGKYSAYGVYALSSGGDVMVHNDDDGEIGFYSYLGNGFGVLGISYLGDVGVQNDGTIAGYAYGQSAGVFAVALEGDATVVNTGSIEAITGGIVAVGVFARADYGTAAVANSGDIVASVEGVNGYIGDDAYGILARGEYAQVSNSGSIYAFGIYSATGIAARSYYGTTVATSASSDIEAYSLLVTIGIEGRSEYGNVSITNAGDIAVEGVLGGGVGIQAYSGLGNASVANSGEIAASSEYGTAIGITGYSVAGNTTVSNSGTVEATGYYGAYGVAAQSYLGDVTVANGATGHIHAEAPSYAYGILATAYGDVTINNAGALSASPDADGHAAAVRMESLHGHSTLNNAATGTISVEGTDGYAFAVVGSEAVDTINNNGLITGALALYGGNDVFNNRSGGVWSTGGTHSTDFGDGNDTLNNLAGGLVDILTGAITFGAGNDTLANAGTVRTGTGGTISFGDGNDTLANATGGLIDVVGGTIAMEAGNDTITNFGTFRLTGGTVTMGAGTNAFTNAGILKALGNSTVDVGAGGTLTNVNAIDLIDGAANDTLTLVGTLGGSGALNIDVNLLTSTADQLVVTGNVAANAVQTVNVLFPGLPATAHSSAVFGRVSGTSVASNFVAGQVIGYSPANFLDLDLTVSSQINAANTAPDLFSVNVDVVGLSDSGSLAASVASGAAGFLNSQIGTFRQRLGVNPYGDAGKVMSAFVRVYSSEGDVDQAHVAANFGQGGNFAYDQSSWGREVGVNANLFGNFHAGVVLGTAESRQRLTGAGVGQNRMDGMTWGAYATWYVPQGFYVDLTHRQMAVDVESLSAAGLLQTRAHTSSKSLEAGYEWAVGGFNIVPQIQYTRTEVEDVRAIGFDRATFASHGGTSERGRLGVEFNKTFNAGNLRWTPYGSISAIREFDGEMTYTVADNFFGSTSVDGTSAMAELGLGVQAGGWGFNIGANWTDGGAYDSGVSGQASVRFAW